jgi:hypothetical protein
MPVWKQLLSGIDLGKFKYTHPQLDPLLHLQIDIEYQALSFAKDGCGLAQEIKLTVYLRF